jgi:two-component system, NarL family, nitrate/nitrite response regulator NarL
MKKTKRIRVLLADDHPVVREGLRSCLAECREVELVGEAADGIEAVAKSKALAPDLVLMDVNLPQLSGLEATEQIRKANPHIKVVALTAHRNAEYIHRMVTAGASGYVMKDSSPDELIQAIETVHGGKTYFSPGIVTELVESLAHQQDHNPAAATGHLSTRERQVLTLIAEGLSNKEMAAALGVSVRTVETHRERLMAKLDIRTVAGLTRYALARGLVREDETRPVPTGRD